MLSRAVAVRGLFPVSLSNARFSSSQVVVWKREILDVKEGPERDTVNFPRYKRPEHPAPVRLGFVPEEFFQFFYPKTGLTGPYLFGIGLVTTLMSKEILIAEHEFMFGIVLFGMLGTVQKLYGKDIAAYIDKQIDKEDAEVSKHVNEQAVAIDDAIKAEERAQFQTGAQEMVYQVKKENVALQLEAEFRRRQLKVYDEVKKKLDYHTEIIRIERDMQQKHMTQWIIDNVLKSISPQQEKEALNKCISDLKGLAARA